MLAAIATAFSTDDPLSGPRVSASAPARRAQRPGPG